MNRATVYFVDDDAAIRDSMALLMQAADLPFMGFQDAESFLAWLPENTIHGCLILDVNMPGMTGPELQNELLNRNLHLPIIFLTGRGDIPTTVRAMKLGAEDFLTKPVDGKQLIRKVRQLFEREQERASQALNRATFQHRLDSLTQREQEIMALAIEGKSNKEIAQQLEISHRTVELHRSHILLKTQSKSFLELSRNIADMSPPANT